MRSFNLKIRFLLVPILFLFANCAKEELYPYEECILCEATLYGTYTNYTGEGPDFIIDAGKTSPYIRYGEATVSPVDTNGVERYQIKIPRITVVKDNLPYNIEKFIVEEYKNGKWALQDEFSKDSFEELQNMAIVLVLDMSTSLGNDVNTVKSEAISFASKFLNVTEGTGYVGIVLFSENVQVFPFSNNLTTIQNNINGYINYKAATQLYGAMKTGLNMLDTTQIQVDGKALIAFTDGGDNATNNPTAVRNEIMSSSIQRYTIGLKGRSVDYDENTLISLASNPYDFANAEESSDLQDAFNKIYDQITNIITVKYNRTQQEFNPSFDAPVQIRFKFILE